MAWQIAITLTFCHTAIDLISDFYPETDTFSPFTMYFFWVFLMTSVVALLVGWLSRKKESVRQLFLLLIWSCILVSFLRLGIDPEKFNIENLSVCEIICDRFIVHLFFVACAVAVSLILNRKFRKPDLILSES
jgi:hypothetical protein